MNEEHFFTPQRTGTAMTVGGTVLAGVGLVGAIDASKVGDVWFATSGAASLVLVLGLVGLRKAAEGLRVVRRALGATAVTMALFGLAHFYALVNQDLAILLFSVFMVPTAIGLIVAGAGIVRHRIGRGWQAGLPLLCGVWPLLTVPAGAAIGDVPHFSAIAIWGLCWVACGLSLSSSQIIASTTATGVGAQVSVGPR